MTCALCGAAGALLYAQVDDALFGTPGRWDLRRCEPCGLVWLDPAPDDATLARAYAAYHTHAAPAAPGLLQRQLRRAIPAATLGYADLPLGDADLPLGDADLPLGDADLPLSGLERLLGRLLGRIGPLREASVRSVMGLRGERRGRLLDVGCGSGLLLSVMRDLGWDVLGLEPDPAARAACRARLGDGRVRAGTLPQPDLPDASFDAVTLVHVIEHLRDPAAALAECRRLLRPGGRLALATPNAASRGSRRFGARWRGFEPPRHLQVYEPRSLRTLCERAGFAVTELATPAPAAVPIWLASQRTSGVLATGRATLFWLREWFDVWRGQEVGEEILLLAHAAAPAGVTR